jgi:hypothetical protein
MEKQIFFAGPQHNAVEGTATANPFLPDSVT